MLAMETVLPDQAEDDDALLSPRAAAAFLSQLWQRPVTVTALRMIRLRRKGDPEMPSPDFVDGDIFLWRKSTLRKIKQPQKYDKRLT